MLIGKHLASYEILEKLGEGGMGEVYRARDTRLQRNVAVKVLPEPFAADAERLARFEREAQTLASLNHPHIAQIYGIERSGATRALVPLSTTDVHKDSNLKWSPRGDALFVRRLVRVLLGEHDGSLEVREQQILSGLPEGSALVGVSPDGQRALVGLPTKAAVSIDGIRVIINGLDAIVGGNRRD